ncbi:MAG: ketoacyl-ACP synthase III [Candidatus Omnitrophica bacterium]|nr:ketoacyl-ACP synthase III [Candidatus Omnitrophota bacterium]
MKNVGIVALGRYLPERKLTNADVEKIVETTDEWIVSRTGIKERRLAASDEKTSDLAVKAALNALKNSPVKAEDIEAIFVATVTPDSNFPSMGCLVQKAIGAKKAFAYDISAACSGFLYAMTTAKQFIASGMVKNALVIAADRFTTIIDWKDRNTCVLFGDGAGAAILSEVKEGGILSDYMISDGDGAPLMEVISDKIRTPFDPSVDSAKLPYVIMNGQELFKHAVPGMAEAVDLAAAKAGVALEDIKCVVPHQANDRIIASVAKRAGIHKEKFFINIDKYGNISAASVVVALCEAVEQGRIKKGDIIALVVFGAGLVAAANIIKWSYEA